MIRSLSLALASIFAAALTLPTAAENAKISVPAAAVNSSANGASQGVSGRAAAPEKTSDRTPDNATPRRSAGAGIYGAAGTEIGKTLDGTSDRTPSNHYRPATN